MEDVIRLFRKQLFSAFWEWVEKNKSEIGEKWHTWFLKKGKDAEDECNNAIKIMATALWIFNMVSGWVAAGIGPNNVNLHHISEGIDEQTTKRLLHLIASCLSLQYLPKELATKEIPIISRKHFSLKLFTESH